MLVLLIAFWTVSMFRNLQNTACIEFIAVQWERLLLLMKLRLRTLNAEKSK